MNRFTLLILILVSSNIFSQNGWELVYPRMGTSGQLFKDISFQNNQTGWVLTGYEAKKTTNGGQTWVTHNLAHLYNTLSCFYMYNENIGWVFEDKFINFTSNGGATWQVLDTSVAAPGAVTFINLLTGWVCGNSGMVKKTTNGGYSWINYPTGVTENLRAISFYDENYGVCAGDWGKILSTTNGGLNWIVFLDNYLGFFSFAKYLNPQTALLSGSGSNIYRTTNSGLNWNLIFTNTSLISSIKFINSQTGYAFGSAGDFFNTTNTGANWNRLPLNGLYSQVNGASYTPDGSFWVAADSGMILSSSNLGGNWNVIYREYLTKEHLNSVCFINNLSGFTCGNRGVLLKTLNGGMNWYHTGNSNTFNFKSIKFINDNTGYISGGNGSYAGIILRTTDFGISWTEVYQDSSHLNAINFINSNTGWAAGYAGVILKTTNGGNTWTRSRYQTSTINDIWFINENTGFICKNGIYKTTNGGAVWNQVSTFNSNAIQFIGNNGYAITQSGSTRYFSKSTNSGDNWVNTQTGNGVTVSLYFANQETGWICSGSTIRRTSNGGTNWIIQPVPGSTIEINSVFFRDTDHGWVVGTYGGIMRTVTGGIGINMISAEVPKFYYLDQNYPNPFNPVTKIRFQIPAFVDATRRGVSLRVYDVLGKEVAILLNEELKPGTYELEWEASMLSSGVYFYSLITIEFTQTRKMVVLK